MSEKQVRKGCALVLAVYVILAVGFFWISGDQLRFKGEEGTAINPSTPVGELVQGMEVRQPFTAPGDEILSVSMLLSTYQRENTVQVVVELVDSGGLVLAHTELNGTEIVDNAVREIPFVQPVSVKPGWEILCRWPGERSR